MIHERRFACICTRQLPNCDFSGSACGAVRAVDAVREGAIQRVATWLQDKHKRQYAGRPGKAVAMARGMVAVAYGDDE